MTNIDAISLATVVGGAGAAAKKPATTTSSPANPQQDAIQLGADAASGCLSGISSKLGGAGGAPNWSQIGVSCAAGALSSLGSGLGKLFGGSSSSATTKSK
ncbi:MAG TPA: hypothetical protein VGG74_20725 [Kofleriaceae bacterium]|jgi:hypothetical protein